MRPGMATTLVRIGLFASLLAAPAGADDGLPDSRLGVRYAPLVLLTRADIRADLGLTPEQAAGADQALGRLRDKAAAVRGRSDAQATAVRAEIDRAAATWLLETLDPPQRERLVQLDIQWEGPSAILSRPLLAESLALNRDQASALAQAIARRNGRRGNGPVVPDDEATLAEATLSILNETQRHRWRAALGRPGPFHLASRPPETAPTRR